MVLMLGIKLMRMENGLSLILLQPSMGILNICP